MFLPSLTLIAVTIGALAHGAFAACQREALQDATDDYLSSQEKGKPSNLLLADGVKYRENNRRLYDIESGILSQPLKINSSRTIFDLPKCATYTEIIVTDEENPWVIGTQLHFDGCDDNIKLALVDTITTTTPDWQFNATKSLGIIQQENWSTIDVNLRDSRKTLKAAGDAYLDLWGNSRAPVPWGMPCRRMEGSNHTGLGLQTDSCSEGIPDGDGLPPNSDRRYVIDEAVGAVSILCKFELMYNAPDSHEFRLEGAKLRYVHTMTVMRKL
ncbi:hypothetical protein GE09DRAFT_1231889 [Coniochaeta sp. 2T2.1]|nr:hypothetical protein GE09DRAFT_1231889 [Coniochaeta sp. 2T2.1]